MAFIEQQHILDATDGGLNIILYYYPQAEQSVTNKNKTFKIREEKTASTSLKQLKDGTWVVTDFGDDRKPRNGIQVCQREENVDFKKALEILAARYGVEDCKSVTDHLPKATFDKRDATPEEEEGSTTFEMLQEIPDAWLKELGPRVTADHCRYLHFKPVKTFTYIKDRTAFITGSTDEYPIFIIEEEGFKKIYQPKNQDKKYRFRYVGTKPKDFIHGLSQAIRKYNQLIEEYTDDGGSEDSKKKEPKLPEIIRCTGGRDAINVFSLGYNVIWPNGETEDLQPRDFKKIMSIADDFYNLPDIDDTGIRQGSELALKYLDIRTIWLPEWLKKKKDFRGNACKDLTDFMKLPSFKTKQFEELLKVAYPARLWDEFYQVSRDGKNGYVKYDFNNVHAYYFLNLNGFWRFENKNESTGYMFIRFVGNIVDEVSPVDIKSHVNNFLEDRKMPAALRNMVYKTTQLGETSLSNLKEKEIDFSDYDKTKQFLFFENTTWEITSEGIKNHRPGAIDRYIWKDEVIEHRVKSLPDFFELKTTVLEDGYLDHELEIKDTRCLFFRYLIQTSRVHWKHEYEIHCDTLDEKAAADYKHANQWKIDGEALTDDQVYEQKMHLLNKMYSLGYLLHRYKDPSRPWCVFAMDHKIADQSQSHGGSGKSICYGSLKHFMKTVTLNGRNRRLTENPHIYENVTEHTDFIFIDDASQWMDFQFFFKAITGDLDVNPKNNRQYTIAFKDAPKMCITSNYTPNNIDPSTERRLLYTVFSDYYHYNSQGEYREHRDPKSEFKKNLFDDFTDEEWNYFFNFMAQCVRLYLGNPKLDPPMDNVNKRNLITEMTEGFQKWADVYFSVENNSLCTDINRHEALEHFKSETNLHKWTTQRFSKSLKAWCRYNGYQLNPVSAGARSDGRIIKSVNGKTQEFIYIHASDAAMQAMAEQHGMPQQGQAGNQVIVPEQKREEF